METKNKIKASAFKLFAERGISFTLSQVANEVGIRKASVYAHFNSKEALLNEIIDEEIHGYFFEINKEQDDLKKIFYGVLDYYDSSYIKLLFWKRLLLLAPESADEAILNKVQEQSDIRFQVVKEVIHSEVERGKIKRDEEMAMCIRFFALVHGLLSSELIYKTKNVREYYDIIWDQFWQSIKVHHTL